MIQNILGQNAILQLQTGAGLAYKGEVMAVNIDVTAPYANTYRVGESFARAASLGYIEWEMTLRGLGDFQVTPELIANYEAVFTSLEWRCDWCGSVQPRARLACEKCGGPRSFIYELMQHSARTWQGVP